MCETAYIIREDEYSLEISLPCLGTVHIVRQGQQDATTMTRDFCWSGAAEISSEMTAEAIYVSG